MGAERHTGRRDQQLALEYVRLSCKAHSRGHLVVLQLLYMTDAVPMGLIGGAL